MADAGENEFRGMGRVVPLLLKTSAILKCPGTRRDCAT